MKIKTYIINMEKDTQKRELIEAQLKSHPELDWQIWRAIEGRRLSEEEQKEMILPDFYKRYGRNATLPAAGCSLSHIAIYKDIIEKKTPYALILEDDAILSDDLKLQKIESLLDTCKPAAILLTSDFWYREENKISEVDSNHNIYQLSDGFMTSGYAINLAAAELLLPKIYPVQYTADAWSTFIKYGLNLYGIVPHIVSYPDGYGEIGLSQRENMTVFERFRSIAVYFYIRLIWVNAYLQGNKRSRKQWK